MSGESRGYHDGRQDAEHDALQDLPPRPRPRFLPSLISDGYQREYAMAYKKTYEAQRRYRERRLAEELAQASKLIAGSQVPKDRAFEQGWRDGFDGKDRPPSGLTHDDLRAYERGHRHGSQTREFELKQRLRRQPRRQHQR